MGAFLNDDEAAVHFPFSALAVIATRIAEGPVAFDLQLLAGNDLLSVDGGGPAELRVEVP